jgi:opacity protein-like surface antigen
MVLAGAACTASIAAADGYPGMKDAPVGYAQPVSWYLRGDYSYSWMEGSELAMPTFSFDSVAVDNTWAAGGGIGYHFGRGVRGDVTYEWRGSTEVRGTSPGNTSVFDLDTSLFLANLYYDFRPLARFTPYVGVGLGVAHHKTGGGGLICGQPCVYDGGSNRTPAAALMAGLSYRIDRGQHEPTSIKDGPVAEEPGRLHVDVGYRFLYLGDVETGNLANVTFATPGPRLEDVTAHELRVGLRWDIR